MKRSFLAALAASGIAMPAVAQEYGDCVIEPFLVVEIGSPVEGVVERIEASRGTFVREGDPIAWLDSSLEHETVRLAEARAASRTGIDIAVARVELEQKEAARAREAIERNIGTQVDLDIAEAELLTAELELVQAEENQMLTGLERDRAQVVLDRRTVRSPIDGIILRRLIGPGEFAHSQAQLAQIAQMHPLHVDVFLPIEIFNEVRVGQVATVLPAEPIGGSYEATIDAIDQVFDAASDTFGVRLKLPNEDFSLPAGVDCAISLP